MDDTVMFLYLCNRLHTKENKFSLLTVETRPLENNNSNHKTVDI